MSDDTTAKAGAAMNRQNRTRLQSMHDMAVQMGAMCDTGPDTSPIGKSREELEAELEAITKALAALDTPIKAGDLEIAAGEDFAPATIKALGDRTIELRVAWGYDGHKEQFHPTRTDFDLENFPSPPVAYYHGYTEAGKPAPKPVYIGKTIKRENRDDGHYLTAKLNTKKEADKVWQAALKGEAAVSPGTAGHLRRRDPDGTLTYWPIVEISAWDSHPARKQAHPQSVAFPVLKALYDEAGIDVPALLDPPETAGDAVSAGDITPEEAARYIVTQVASAVLATNTRNT